MLEEVVEPLPPVLADFSRVQGTATCFEPPEVELEVADVGEVVPVLPEEDVLFSLEPMWKVSKMNPAKNCLIRCLGNCSNRSKFHLNAIELALPTQDMLRITL